MAADFPPSSRLTRVRLGGAGHGDVASRRGGPGERDLVDARVRDEVLPDLATAGENAHDAGREPDLLEQVGEQQCVERCLRRRLQDDGAPGEKRRERAWS